MVKVTVNKEPHLIIPIQRYQVRFIITSDWFLILSQIKSIIKLENKSTSLWFTLKEVLLS